jgi:hypothetical protein
LTATGRYTDIRVETTPPNTLLTKQIVKRAAFEVRSVDIYPVVIAEVKLFLFQMVIPVREAVVAMVLQAFP